MAEIYCPVCGEKKGETAVCKICGYNFPVEKKKRGRPKKKVI